jgi:propionyl-CoA synthetase
LERGGARIDWIEPANRCSIRPWGFTAAGSRLVVNTCYNALDRHVANGRADQVALIHDSPLAGTVAN